MKHDGSFAKLLLLGEQTVNAYVLWELTRKIAA
jgi:hypothetical protein